MRRCLLLALALAACEAPGAPTGQVVARIDGIEVTRRDVLIELIASGAPADVDTSTVQPALLDAIIDRKLLAREAERQSIDRSPEFLGRERRSREAILADQLAQRVVGRLPQPSAASIAHWIVKNRTRPDVPTDLAQRTRIAATMVQDAAARRAIAATLHRLRAQARIAYQPGFGPR